MRTRQIARWYFLASGCFWSSLISVHGFLVLTAKDKLSLSPENVTIPMILLHLAVVALEVPTGAIADSWSRSKSAALGQLLVAFSLCFLPFLDVTKGAETTAGLIGFAILFATGWSLFSGSLKGLISQHIREHDPELMSWFVKSNSAWNNSFILAVTILYPILYALHWKLVWFTAATLALFSLILSLPLVRFEKASTESTNRVGPIQSFKTALISFRQTPQLMSLSLISIILFSLATTFESTLQTHASSVAGVNGFEKNSTIENLLTPAWFAWFFLTLGSLAATKFDFRKSTLLRIDENFRSKALMTCVILLFSFYALISSYEQAQWLKSMILAIAALTAGWLITIARNDNAAQLQSAITHGRVTSTVFSINSLFQDLVSSIFLSFFLLPQSVRAGVPWSWSAIATLSALAVILLLDKVSKKVDKKEVTAQ